MLRGLAAGQHWGVSNTGPRPPRVLRIGSQGVRVLALQMDGTSCNGGSIQDLFHPFAERQATFRSRVFIRCIVPPYTRAPSLSVRTEELARKHEGVLVALSHLSGQALAEG